MLKRCTYHDEETVSVLKKHVPAKNLRKQCVNLEIISCKNVITMLTLAFAILKSMLLEQNATTEEQKTEFALDTINYCITNSLKLLLSI